MSRTIDCGEGRHAACSGSGTQPYLIPQEAGPRFYCGCWCHHDPDPATGKIAVPCKECEAVAQR